MEAEREAVAMYRAYLMRDQVGQRFDGVVSAVTSFGAFVELEEPFVEGLIKLESLGDDQFSFDEIHMRLSGRRTGATISLGDKVTVEINNVSVVRRRIDFTLVAAQTAGRKPRKTAERAAVPAPEPRVGLARRKKAGREVERAVRSHVEPGARPRRGAAAAGGKLRLGVSHRAPREDSDGDRKKRGKRRK
jgi:ribonuclease R